MHSPGVIPDVVKLILAVAVQEGAKLGVGLCRLVALIAYAAALGRRRQNLLQAHAGAEGP